MRAAMTSRQSRPNSLDKPLTLLHPLRRPLIEWSYACFLCASVSLWFVVLSIAALPTSSHRGQAVAALPVRLQMLHQSLELYLRRRMLHVAQRLPACEFEKLAIANEIG